MHTDRLSKGPFFEVCRLFSASKSTTKNPKNTCVEFLVCAFETKNDLSKGKSYLKPGLDTQNVAKQTPMSCSGLDELRQLLRSLLAMLPGLSDVSSAQAAGASGVVVLVLETEGLKEGSRVYRIVKVWVL